MFIECTEPRIGFINIGDYISLHFKATFLSPPVPYFYPHSIHTCIYHISSNKPHPLECCKSHQALLLNATLYERRHLEKRRSLENRQNKELQIVFASFTCFLLGHSSTAIVFRNYSDSSSFSYLRTLRL